MESKRNRLSIFILLLLFVFYYASCNLFPHIHNVDGVEIVHSHPYSNDGHSHTRGSLDIFSILTFTPTTFIVGVLFVAYLCATILFVYKRDKRSFIYVDIKLRAPPTLNYCLQ